MRILSKPPPLHLCSDKLNTFVIFCPRTEKNYCPILGGYRAPPAPKIRANCISFPVFCSFFISLYIVYCLISPLSPILPARPLKWGFLKSSFLILTGFILPCLYVNFALRKSYPAPNFSKVFRPLLSIPVLIGYFGPPKGLRGYTIYSGY